MYCFIFSLLFFTIQIFPYELDSIFLSHPGVVDSATVGVNHPDSGQVPHCFVISDQEATVNEYMLKQLLNGKYILDIKAVHIIRH